MENKKKFEIKNVFNPDGTVMQGIFIDGEYFDWGVDEESYQWAQKQGPQFLMTVQQDIMKHFMESLSEMVGRRVTPSDVEEAKKTGWI